MEDSKVCEETAVTAIISDVISDAITQGATATLAFAIRETAASVSAEREEMAPCTGGEGGEGTPTLLHTYLLRPAHRVCEVRRVLLLEAGALRGERVG